MPLFSRPCRLLWFGLLPGVCLASGFASRPAHALPTTSSLPGITGLGDIPTADTVLPGAAEISLGYERIRPQAAAGKVDLLPLAGVIYGFRKAEIGATYVRESSDIEGFSFRGNYFALQGKIRVYERQNLGVAVGAHYYDFGSEGGNDLGSVLSGYASASYSLPRDQTLDSAPRARFHSGVLLQRSRGGGQKDTLVRPFVGAEYFVSSEVSLGADYLAKDKDAARAATLSLRYTPQNSPLSAQIGAGKLHRDTRYFVGISYRFGPSGAQAPPPLSPENTVKVTP